jgi:NAD(P)-dependent dehydrogenase (short-subunit alcohol dehydrogenase family)
MIPRPFKPEADLLAGRVILITGAGGGLGKALAVECARAGAGVILSGRTQSKLDRVYDEIVALGAPQPAIATLDLAAATALDYDSLANTIDGEFGKLDGVVHAAALLGDRTPLEQYDVPTWCRVLHVNLTAPFILTQVLLPNLRKSKDHAVTRTRRRTQHSSEQRESGTHAHCDACGRLSGREPQHRAHTPVRERAFFVLAE